MLIRQMVLIISIMLAALLCGAWTHGNGSGNFLTDAGGANILLDGGGGLLVAS